MIGLGLAIRSIPLGTAYAVWVGIGAALTVGWAMATGVEPFSLLKVLFIAGIVGCAAGLKSLPADVTSAADRSETRVPA
jgi:quaternary ammonium compound-resistance protein SugE